MQTETNRTNWISLVLILVLMLTASGCQKNLTGIEIPITTHGAVGLGFTSNTKNIVDIYNNIIVWRDSRDTNSHIYMYNISTGTETQITTDTDFRHLNPTIHGNKIVWESYCKKSARTKGKCDIDPGHTTIYNMYDIVTKTRTQIATGSSSRSPMAISDQIVVWESQKDIYMYDISSGVETQLTIDNDRQESPAIFDQTIVWVNSHRDSDTPYYSTPYGYSNHRTIYSYNIHTGIKTQISSGTDEWVGHPAIHNDKIIWVNGHRNIYLENKVSIYVYDLATKEKTHINITHNDHSSIHPDIYDNKIVWDDTPGNSVFGIYVYDLDTKIKTKITTDNSSQVTPAIYDNKIIWLKHQKDTYWNVYFYEFAE